MYRIVLIILFITGGSDVLQAQEQTSVSLNLNVISPQGGFRQNLDRMGYGLAGVASYRFEETPFALGMEVQFNNYGFDSRQEPLSSTIPDLKVTVDNRYNQYAVLMAARLEPLFESSIQPYLEGLVGGNYYFTETTINNRSSVDDEPIARDTNIHDTVMSWGGGAGLNILIHEPDDTSTISVVFLTVSVRYMYGNEAKYLKEGSVSVANGSVSFDTSRSRTDLISYQIGLTLKY